MKLQTFILHQTADRTISQLVIDGKFFCFICEDGHHETKIPGETRIPAGTYKIVRRYEGKFYQKYKQQYKHEFAIWIKDVEGFEYILMHVGNTPEDTRGCLLVGMGWQFTGQTHFISESGLAYQKLYNTLAPAFFRGEEITIEINRTTALDAMRNVLNAVG